MSIRRLPRACYARRVLAVVLTVAAVAVPVRWTAPPGCPQAAQAEPVIAAELSTAEGVEAVQANVAEGAAGFAVEVEVVLQEGAVVRVVDLPDCARG